MRNQVYRIRKMPKAKSRTWNFSHLLIILSIKNTLLEKRQLERNNKLTKFLGYGMNLSYAHPPSALDLIPLQIIGDSDSHVIIQNFEIRTGYLSFSKKSTKSSSIRSSRFHCECGVESVGSKIFGLAPASWVTLLILPRKFFTPTSIVRSANTNFFYSVYPYRRLEYLTDVSGNLGDNFHNNQIKIEFYFELKFIISKIFVPGGL